MKKLARVVDIDTSKCVNCNKCIRECPVNYCNDGSKTDKPGGHIDINTDMCIGCGGCIGACPHGARLAVDDTEAFFADLHRGTKIVAVVAPAIASSFPNKYLHFNTWLKSLGVEAVFDVCFGAELAIKSYVEHIKKNSPKLVIAQPCSTLVSYIQIYRPELLPYLVPVHSPMMITIVMVKEFFPQFRNHKFAVISPCVSKKREFDETKLGDYNVTMAKLDDYLREHRIDLARFEPSDYDNPSAERAALLSSPGGLMHTAMREVLGIDEKTRKIEGPIVYPYLDELGISVKKGINPLLIDCLNCENGCNGGPGTNHIHTPVDELEYLINTRSDTQRHQYEEEEHEHPGVLHERIDAYWKPGIYDRRYLDLRGNNMAKIPNDQQIQTIYRDKLSKRSDHDILDCGACGYDGCHSMATALHNDLSHPGLCFMKHQIDLTESKKEFSENSAKHEKFANGLFKSVEAMVGDIEETASLMQGVNAETKEMSDMISVIAKIARQTNLLALNASIEAARAGQYGRGFAVVAEEVRSLAKSSNEAAETIATLVTDVSKRIHNGADLSKKVEETLVEIMAEAKQELAE